MADRNNKYMWSSKEMDEYCKREAEDMRKNGFQASTAGVTRLIHDRVLAPNNIKVSDLIKPKITINKKKWKKQNHF